MLELSRLTRQVLRTVAVAAALVAAASIASAQTTTDTVARHAILIEYSTGQVLFQKDADALIPPASMSKMMLLYILFENLAEGKLSLDDTFPVSEKAWRMGGSKMFVEVGKRISIRDLLRGIIVQSGNDACIVVAEGLGGTE